MKVTQKQAVEGYQVIRKMEGEKLPIKTAFGFFRLKGVLEPFFQFQVQKEADFIHAVDAEIEPDGAVFFKDPAQTREFNDMVAELHAQECEINVEPVSLPEELMISMKDLEALEPFLEKEGEA